MMHTDYWKLECSAGKYPFTFAKMDRSGMFYGAGILIDEAAPLFTMYVITENGKAKVATAHYRKKLFAQDPEILESYSKSEKQHLNAVKQEHMIMFNKYLASH